MKRTAIVSARLSATTAAAALAFASEASAICYQHPVQGYVISNPYGTSGPYYTSGYHRGVDYAGLPIGTPVRAVAEGQVVRSLYQGCQGNVVVVQHPDGMFSSYSHLANGSRAGVGTWVGKGGQVGALGATGTCLDGAHLHLVIAPHIDGFTTPPEVEPYGFIEGHQTCCTDGCDGNTLRRSDCSSVDCAAQDATCRHDGAGLRCVPNCYDRCLGNVLERADCSRQDCGDTAVCRASGELRCDPQPRGWLDSVGPSGLSGWAQDPSTSTQAIQVDLWFGGPPGAMSATKLATLSDRPRPDLCATLGSCDHGFVRRTPRSLMDGVAREVHAYGLDASGGDDRELQGSPKILTVPPPPVPPGALLRRVFSHASFEAWRFSDFEDVAPLAGESGRLDPSHLKTPGLDFPTTPDFVTGDDGSATSWMLDAGWRRHVRDPAAWRLGAPKPMPTPQLLLIPKGPDWPESPELVRTAGPVDFVVDSPLPGPRPPEPAQGAGGAAGAVAAGAGAHRQGAAGAPNAEPAPSASATSAGGCGVVSANRAAWQAGGAALAIGMLARVLRRATSRRRG